MSWSPGRSSATPSFVPTNRGEGWGAGGGGDAIGATLVSTVPLPATRAEKEQVLANESKGVTESLPKPEEKSSRKQ